MNSKRQLTIFINEETESVFAELQKYYKKKTGPMVSWVLERLCENGGKKIQELFPEVPIENPAGEA